MIFFKRWLFTFLNSTLTNHIFSNHPYHPYHPNHPNQGQSLGKQQVQHLGTKVLNLYQGQNFSAKGPNLL